MAVVGKTPQTWQKHHYLWEVLRAQAACYRVHHPGPWLVVDMHAGDAIGMPAPQGDFFRETTSLTTPEMAHRLAGEMGDADVLLCEKDPRLQPVLAARFPTAQVIGNHQLAPAFVRPPYRWALVVNDPNGYAGHGIETMQQIAAALPADFVIIFNEGALERLCGMREHTDWTREPHGDFIANVRAAKAKYAWMLEPQAWGQALGRRYVARSRRINASAGFRYRILVVSNGFSRVIRAPRWEIFAC